MQRWYVILIIILSLLIVYLCVCLIYSRNLKCHEEWTISKHLEDTIKGTFVLHLSRRKDKEVHMKNLMRDLNLPFTFVEGYDAKEKGVGHVCPKSKKKPGKIGCVLGHINLFETIAKQHKAKESDWFLAFQDDAVPTMEITKVKARMAEAIRRASLEDRPLIYFGFCMSPLEWMRGYPLDRYRWVCPAACPHAIAITKRGANDILSYLKKGLCKTNADFAMRSYMKDAGATLVCANPFSPMHPGRQFMTKPSQLYGRGLFGQKREDLTSDISF